MTKNHELARSASNLCSRLCTCWTEAGIAAQSNKPLRPHLHYAKTKRGWPRPARRWIAISFLIGIGKHPVLERARGFKSPSSRSVILQSAEQTHRLELARDNSHGAFIGREEPVETGPAKRAAVSILTQPSLSVLLMASYGPALTCPGRAFRTSIPALSCRIRQSSHLGTLI